MKTPFSPFQKQGSAPRAAVGKPKASPKIERPRPPAPGTTVKMCLCKMQRGTP
jgi:hypothetical protein